MSYKSKTEIAIPRVCPKCSGKMFAISWDVIFNILKQRSWHICKSCNYEQSADDFKKGLFTI